MNRKTKRILKFLLYGLDTFKDSKHPYFPFNTIGLIIMLITLFFSMAYSSLLFILASLGLIIMLRLHFNNIPIRPPTPMRIFEIYQDQLGILTTIKLNKLNNIIHFSSIYPAIKDKHIRLIFRR